MAQKGKNYLTSLHDKVIGSTFSRTDSETERAAPYSDGSIERRLAVSSIPSAKQITSRSERALTINKVIRILSETKVKRRKVDVTRKTQVKARL